MSIDQIQKINTDLAKLVDGDVMSDIFNRIAYSTDASIYQIVPSCVVCPKNSEDVAAVVKYASVNNIPIAGRGAGSGLAGECLTEGIVIDFRRYMNKIISMEAEGTQVVCQPGAVLADLNNYLAKFGKKIGPDPSSGNRAVIGGVVANNATGAHSLQYGYIAEHVASIETVLANGEIVRFENNCDPARLTGPAAEIAKSCLDILTGKEETIAKAQPRTKRNRSGYNIANICRDGKIDMTALLAGSEGTLGVFTEITLKTVDLPKAKGLLQLEFDSFENMACAVPIITAGGAAACELMDRKVMDLALETMPEYSDIFPSSCQAVLLVEQVGDSPAQVLERIEKCISDVGSLSGGSGIFLEEDAQLRIWKSRKDAVPLLSREKGHRRPVPFIEDVSVENVQLANYVNGMAKIGEKYDIPMAFYGHAGDGELHLRPYLDLSEDSDIQKMKDIANDVFTLAWSLGGTISGEHADGLVRAPFIRKQYGDEYYELLRSIKNAFDPAAILNPDKIISSDPDIMTRNLRASRKMDECKDTVLNFQPDEFRFEIGQCNGCGVCTSTQPGTALCPVYRATGDELGCSRAKANLLRAAITGMIDEKDLKSDEYKRILSLCINCKRCTIECPSGVDISKLIIEARAQLAKTKPFTRTEKLMIHNRLLSMMGSTFKPLSNFFLSLAPFKWFLEKAVGLDKRRSMPTFAGRSFIQKGRKHLKSLAPISEPVDKVAYFTDTYAAYNDHDLGFAVINTLHHNNIEVTIPDQRPAPLPAMAYGDIKTARKDLTFNVASLAKAVRDGYKIVCSEPSAALCLKDELRLLIDSDDARDVSQNTYELMDYLAELNAKGKLKPATTPQTAGYIYHSPCHLKALGASGKSIALLADIAGVKVTDVNAGCCGLSGTFGMQKKNYDLSLEIARDLADAIDTADQPCVLTECAACKMQIAHLTGKEVVHPIKVLAKAYGM
ncbi:MAG: anaerobic glycerol-3-phosphate dehydrogenase subunit C [Planctomycetes bacterium]|nr:anaerobic glycerol-3-phosphate dehydrogenase subunit C [Planctomycetota bacterium]